MNNPPSIVWHSVHSYTPARASLVISSIFCFLFVFFFFLKKKAPEILLTGVDCMTGTAFEYSWLADFLIFDHGVFEGFVFSVGLDLGDTEIWHWWRYASRCSLRRNRLVAGIWSWLQQNDDTTTTSSSRVGNRHGDSAATPTWLVPCI